MNNQNQLNFAKYFEKDAACLWFLFAFVLLLIAPIIYWGIPDGFDLQQHYQFSINYYDAIKSGDFFLNWSAKTNYGFGDIGQRFYPPSAHYLMALTQILTNDWFTTSWLNIFFWLLLGSLGSYFLARQWLSPQYSLWVGMLYAAAPYHLTQIYQYYLYSEFAAAGVLPFCFLFMHKVCRTAKLRDALLLSLSVSFLILTHIPTTIVGIISLTLFAIILLDRKSDSVIIPKLILGGFTTLCLTAFYWSRLVTEMNWLSHAGERFSTGPYSYKNAFFPFFFNPTDLYFIKQMWYRDIVGFSTLVFFLPFIFVIIRQYWREKTFSKINLAILLTGIFPIFMSSKLSMPVWEIFSPLQKIQFPFRWLSVAMLFGVLGFVLATRLVSQQNSFIQIAKRYSIVVFLLVVSLFNISQVILPAANLSREKIYEQLDGLGEKESFDCWWTIWADKKAFEQREKVLAANRVVKINLWEGERREFEIAAGEETNVRIATFYYPYWQAKINGAKAEIERNRDGTISLALPEEKAFVSLDFIEPFGLKIAKGISLISWVLLFFAGLLFLYRKRQKGLNLEVVG